MRCRHYVLNEGVGIICDKAFFGWDNLESIEIPSSVEVIGDFVFWRCRVLDKVIIPESVTTLIGNPFRSWNVYHPISFTRMMSYSIRIKAKLSPSGIRKWILISFLKVLLI